MFQRLAEKSSAFAGLLESKARLVARDLEQAGALCAAYFGAAVCAAVGVILLLGAMVVGLNDLIGLPGALGCAGLLALLLGMLVPTIARGMVETRYKRNSRKTRQDIEREAEMYREQLTAHAPAPNHHSSAATASKIAETLTDHSQLIGSGALAALAILGPRRTLRLVATAASAASAAASISKLLNDLTEQKAPPVHQNGAAPRSPGRTSEAPSVAPDEVAC